MRWTLKEFQQKYEEFVWPIDDLNLEEKLKKLPHEKHFYVARYMDAKIERDQLDKKLKVARSKASSRIMEDAPVALNSRELNSSLDSLESIQEINDQIKELDYVVQYLDMAIKQITFMGNDLKNLIELKKMELM